jgi:hypothetical protein
LQEVQFVAAAKHFVHGRVQAAHAFGVLLKNPLGQLVKHDVPFR